jgi:hypothetical protein
MSVAQRGQKRRNVLSSYHKVRRRRPMTQIVCALCEDRSKIVFVSDRMVSSSDDSLHFEHEPKGQMMSRNTMVFSTGTTHEPEIIDEARAEIVGRRMGITQMAEILSNHYQSTRRKSIEIAILSKHGLRSFDEYLSKQQLLADDVIRDIEGELENYEFDLEIMLGGIDSKAKGQIYLVHELEKPQSYTDIGFCSLGSGERHTDPVFAFYGYSLSMPVEQVLFISYMAKKRAEMAGGVGETTDIWIMDAEGCYKVLPRTIVQLDGYRTQIDVSSLHGSIDIKFEDSPELPPEEEQED